MKKVWPLKNGLLVERLVASDNGSDGLPTIFSLLHPMDDFCPVTCRKPTPSELQAVTMIVLAKILILSEVLIIVVL